MGFDCQIGKDKEEFSFLISWIYKNYSRRLSFSSHQLVEFRLAVYCRGNNCRIIHCFFYVDNSEMKKQLVTVKIA